MTDLLLHRRLMQQQGGGLINGYVADGLMLYLDGIDKGGTSGVWTDLIGGEVFTPNGGVVFNSDNVQTTSLTGALYNSTFWSDIDTSYLTVEVCISLDRIGGAGATLFYCRYNSNNGNHPNPSQPALIVRGGAIWNVQGYAVARAPQYQYVRIPTSTLDITRVKTLSMNTTVCLADGINIEYLTGDYHDIGSSVYGIGNTKSYYGIQGKIYSIRVYSRILTQSEQLLNQQNDNIRFNLGLSI